MTDYKLVPVELKELLASMVKLHESKGTVLTVHMHQLREMLAAGAAVQGEPAAITDADILAIAAVFAGIHSSKTK